MLSNEARQSHPSDICIQKNHFKLILTRWAVRGNGHSWASPSLLSLTISASKRTFKAGMSLAWLGVLGSLWNNLCAKSRWNEILWSAVIVLGSRWTPSGTPGLLLWREGRKSNYFCNNWRHLWSIRSCWTHAVLISPFKWLRTKRLSGKLAF